jgi:hypothetical protein
VLSGLELLRYLALATGARSSATIASSNSRYIAGNNPLSEAFHNRGLTYSWFTDQHRVVLGSSRKNLNYPPDFLVPPYNWVELSAPRQLRQIPRVSLQRLILTLRILVCDALVATNGNQHMENVFRRDFM